MLDTPMADGMRVDVLCSSELHPVYPYLQQWVTAQTRVGIDARLIHRKAECRGGVLLFLVSCNELISAAERQAYQHCLVLHASDVPRGRGWSPHIWRVLEGADHMTLTLLEAEDKVDSGRIWLQQEILLDGTELYDELNHKLFVAELHLMSRAVQEWQQIQPQPQPNVEASYYPRRTPEDSRLDVDKSLAEQFNLLRVCDPQRFPAFFEYRGQRYAVKIEKLPTDTFSE